MERRPGVKRAQSGSGGSSKNPRCGKRTWESIGLCPEILNQVFRNADFERLKIYRLVCKTWNKEICRVMNATADVTMSEESQNMKFSSPLAKRSKLKRFVRFKEVGGVIHRTTALTKVYYSSIQSIAAEGQVDRDVQLLELLREGEKMGLPIPFKRLSLTRKFSNDDNLKTSVVRELSVRIAITRVAFILREPCPNPEILKYVMDLLPICSETLTDLEIQFWDATQCCQEIPIQFPRLNNLTLTYSVYSVRSSVELELLFFESIISSSPTLKELVLNGISCLPKLLQTVDLSKVEDLSLLVDHEGGSTRKVINAWRNIENASLQGLKALYLGPGMNESVSVPVDFRTVISIFSESIERLRVPYFIVGKLPFCPKLTHLDCDSLLADAWDPNLLPALKSLKIKYFKEVGHGLRPFPNVQEICCPEFSPLKPMFFPEREEKRVAVGQLVGLLPNATSWTLLNYYLPVFLDFASSHELNVENLIVGARGEIVVALSMLNKYSGLKDLTICNWSSYSAKNKLQIEALNFQKMPKLRTFRFVGLGLEDTLELKEHLRSLNRVVMVCADSENAKSETEELLTKMPNLEFEFTNQYTPMFDPIE